MSRQRLLDQCPRAYFFRYYAGWNGWLVQAPRRSRIAYRLSKLTGLDAVFGQEMDRRAREIEWAAREGRPLPGPKELEARTRATLNAVWVSSKDRSVFEESPKSTIMLRSVYMSEDAEPDISRVKNKISPCIEALLSLDHWDRLSMCWREGSVTIPDFAHFFLNGVKVFAAADLAYVHEGTLYVMDWKTGKESEDDDTQVLISTYSLRENDEVFRGLPVQATVHYLARGQSLRVQIPDDEQAQVEAVVEEGVLRMRRYLRDPEGNIPLDEEDFPQRETGLCRYCNFMLLCKAN
ncbi:MAG: PD-(D/E)XK nuclease family protein [Actinobacteria bacterium]|nr:PD-(D/E)XK nuclease family protein [Actinomycetota bacterium]